MGNIREIFRWSWVLGMVCISCSLTGQLESRAAAEEEIERSSTGKLSQSGKVGKLEMFVSQTPAIPAWCKQEERISGAWHTLSDDEYTDESPYLRCAFPRGSLIDNPSRRHQRRAARAAARTAKRNPQSCADALQIPKVAMMFLTQGSLPHEPIWERWLAAASDFVPTLCTANAVCARGGFQVLSGLRDACGAGRAGERDAYNKQFLFSVYIHSPPNHPLRGEKSVFYGRDNLVPRLETRWGEHSTVEVTRRLLQAALKDSDNQRFILLSESCIPLYSPLIVYQQLMHESRSRISACAIPGWDRSVERYNIRMAAGRRENGRISAEKWRKHMHWFSLLRFHAELVANDTEVVDTFARDCFTGYDLLCAEPNQYRFCIGDEHYISTLLAVYGLDAETDCMGKLTHAAFSRLSAHPEHPKAYTPGEVNATLIRNLRGAQDEVIAATNFANTAFRRMENFDSDASVWHVPYPDVKQLKSQFYLFARKFPAETSNSLMRTFVDNDAGGARLNIFGGLHRSGELPFRETNFEKLTKARP